MWDVVPRLGYGVLEPALIEPAVVHVDSPVQEVLLYLVERAGRHSSGPEPSLVVDGLLSDPWGLVVFRASLWDAAETVEEMQLPHLSVVSAGPMHKGHLGPGIDSALHEVPRHSFLEAAQGEIVGILGSGWVT